MIRRATRPLPAALTAALLFGNGISRHGASCGCRYCSAPVTTDPKACQAIPVIK